MFGSTQNATLTIYSISCTSQILFEIYPNKNTSHFYAVQPIITI